MFECAICLEDNILEVNMHYMECLHYVCFDCFNLLRDDSCPYCRQKINLSLGHNDVTDDEDENITAFENDFVIRRQHRNEIKRKKRKNNKQELNNIIQSQNKLNILPNIKNRFNRKLENIFV